MAEWVSFVLVNVHRFTQINYFFDWCVFADRYDNEWDWKLLCEKGLVWCLRKYSVNFIASLFSKSKNYRCLFRIGPHKSKES